MHGAAAAAAFCSIKKEGLSQMPFWMGLLRNHSQRLKATPSLRIKRFFKSLRGEPRVGSDNTPIRAVDRQSYHRAPSLSEFEFGIEEASTNVARSESEQAAATGTPQRTLQIEGGHDLSRQISPHRSPPNQPYASGSSVSGGECEPQTSGSMSYSSTECDIPSTSPLRPPRRESVVLIPPKSPFRLISPVSPVVEHVEDLSSETSSVYSERSEELNLAPAPMPAPAPAPAASNLRPYLQDMRAHISSNPFAVPAAVRSKPKPKTRPMAARVPQLVRQSVMSEFIFASTKIKSRQSRAFDQDLQSHYQEHQRYKAQTRRESSTIRSSRIDSRRVSVASSMASMLPYILKFNSEEWEHPAPKAERTQASFASSLLHDDNAVPELSTPQQIERILAQQSTASLAQPPKIAKIRVEEQLLACESSVADYASSLDREFEQYQGVEPDSEFRERILRKNYPVRRRIRFLDKDLPALPAWTRALKMHEEEPMLSSAPIVEQPSRINLLCQKFKLT